MACCWQLTLTQGGVGTKVLPQKSGKLTGNRAEKFAWAPAVSFKALLTSLIASELWLFSCPMAEMLS